MAVRVARPASAIGRAVTFLALIGAGPLAAAEVEVPVPAPPALSPSCFAPASDIATAAPLPHLQEKLQAKSTIRVLAIGSSTTVGIGASAPAQSYPAQLEAILEKAFKGLDVVMVNRGVSGETSATTAERMRTLVGLEKPDLVLWQVGTNDAMMRVPVEDFTSTVRDTVRWLKERDVDTVLVGLQYTLKASKDPHYKAIRMALGSIASSENILLVRRYEAMEFIEHGRTEELISSDGVHMNDLGYRCLAEHIARAMVVSAFLRPKPAKPPKT